MKPIKELNKALQFKMFKDLQQRLPEKQFMSYNEPGYLSYQKITRGIIQRVV